MAPTKGAIVRVPPTTPTISGPASKSSPTVPIKPVPKPEPYKPERKIEKTGPGAADNAKEGAKNLGKKGLEGSTIAVLKGDKLADTKAVKVEDQVSTHRSESDARKAAQKYSKENGGENVAVVRQSPDPDSPIKFMRNPTVYHVVTLDPGVDIDHVDDLIDLAGDNFEIVAVGNEDGMRGKGPIQRPIDPPRLPGRPPTDPPNPPFPPDQMPPGRPPRQMPPIQILPMPFPLPADPPQAVPLDQRIPR